MEKLTESLVLCSALMLSMNGFARPSFGVPLQDEQTTRSSPPPLSGSIRVNASDLEDRNERSNQLLKGTEQQSPLDAGVGQTGFDGTTGRAKLDGSAKETSLNGSANQAGLDGSTKQTVSKEAVKALCRLDLFNCMGVNPGWRFWRPKPVPPTEH